MRRFVQPRINWVVLRVVGGPRSPYGIVHHLGRISGRQHRTPVMVQRRGRFFIIPLLYGEDVNWCRNVFATATCDIRWRGATYTAVDPRLLGSEIVDQRLSRTMRSILALTGTRRYLMLRVSEPRVPR
jgi:deazaflavin-dependent oxidoreductase (nitroreductase family)